MSAGVPGGGWGQNNLTGALVCLNGATNRMGFEHFEKGVSLLQHFTVTALMSNAVQQPP